MISRLLSLSRAIDWINEKTGKGMSWLVLLMVLIGVYNAVTRKLSQTIGWDLSSNAYLETQWYLFSAIFLWTGAYALQRGVHVRVDVIYGKLGPKGQSWIEILGTLFFLWPLCGLVLWASLPFVESSWRILEASPDPGGLPRYIIKTAIPMAFVLLVLQGLSEVIKRVAFLRGHEVQLPGMDKS